MKLSEQTLNVLKNFATINDGLVLKKGKTQKTISPEQTILVEAELPEDFPESFGIYDLSQFLGNVTALNDPEMTFSRESVIMDDGHMKLNYYSCSTNLIISPPDKELVLKKIDVKFDLSAETFKKILRLSLMNNLSNITVLGKQGELRLQTHERKDDTSNFAYTKIADHNGDDFSVSFKTENLKLIPDDYHVEIMIGGFAKFTNKAGNIKYFIAAESK